MVFIISEKNRDNMDEVMKLYDMDRILFDECHLISEKLEYIISYIPRLKVYDVIIRDLEKDELVRYESRGKLSGSTLKYFNVYRDDVIDDNFGNHFICKTHFIEYE